MGTPPPCVPAGCGAFINIASFRFSGIQSALQRDDFFWRDWASRSNDMTSVQSYSPILLFFYIECGSFTLVFLCLGSWFLLDVYFFGTGISSRCLSVEPCRWDIVLWSGGRPSPQPPWHISYLFHFYIFLPSKCILTLACGHKISSSSEIPASLTSLICVQSKCVRSQHLRSLVRVFCARYAEGSLSFQRQNWGIQMHVHCWFTNFSQGAEASVWITTPLVFEAWCENTPLLNQPHNNKLCWNIGLSGFLLVQMRDDSW